MRVFYGCKWRKYVKIMRVCKIDPRHEEVKIVGIREACFPNTKK